MDYYNMNYLYRHQEDSDYGGNPFVVNIKDMSQTNNDFRRALWTGNNLQMTLMNINVGEDIGAEMHPQIDQIIIVASGHGVFLYGDSLEHLDNQTPLFKHSTIFIPEKTYHNIVNTSNEPLTLISIYAPPNHPFGTVQKEKQAHFHY